MGVDVGVERCADRYQDTNTHSKHTEREREREGERERERDVYALSVIYK